MIVDILKDRIEKFVAHADKVSADYFAKMNYSMPPTRHEAKFISDKWCRVEAFDPGSSGRRVFAFIALMDNDTRTLGHIVAGGIYMPASFKAPAKHARGSVLDDNWSCVGPHGIAHLK